MDLTTTSKITDRPEADVIVLPFWQGVKKAEPACKLDLFKSDLAPLGASLFEDADFKAKEGETVLIYTPHHKEGRLLLLGIGPQKNVSPEVWRRAVSSAIRLCHQKGWTSLNFICPDKGSYYLPIAEGVLLSNYVFDALKKEAVKENRKKVLKKACLIGVESSQASACKRTQVIIDSVNFARDLVNGNADDITPQKLSEVAEQLCRSSPALKATILGKKELTKAGLGLLLAVNRASFRDPALIIVQYKGKPASKECTALVGKGITYDTGGLNLKPKDGMVTMKDDMSGAATVLGVLRAVSLLKLPVNVIGVIPSTENAIGSKSYKLGDVYTSYSGKTVEIADTDAEGRLVLADAISYLQDHYHPTRIIDLATLTGGVVVALGEHATGLFSNDDRLSHELFEAGQTTHERVWRFPLYPEYKEALKSSIADIKNAADRKASSITGAIFIQEFVKQIPQQIPWAHLDIAGTAYLSQPRHYHFTPATGVGVRLLVEFLSKGR